MESFVVGGPDNGPSKFGCDAILSKEDRGVETELQANEMDVSL
jgi:hypothetical protein